MRSLFRSRTRFVLSRFSETIILELSSRDGSVTTSPIVGGGNGGQGGWATLQKLSTPLQKVAYSPFPALPPFRCSSKVGGGNGGKGE